MFRNFGIGVGDKPSGISMEAVANPPKPVERMYTPVNYRYRIAEDAEAEAGIPGPMARPELRRESDRRRRGSRDEICSHSPVVLGSSNQRVGPGPISYTPAKAQSEDGPGRSHPTWEIRCAANVTMARRKTSQQWSPGGMRWTRTRPSIPSELW
eukprot:s2187_g6.t4